MMQLEAPPIYELHTDGSDFWADVCTGLRQRQRSIPPKYFYDGTGSALFEQICDTPEYYPTRTETAILQRYGDEMAGMIGQPCVLIEFGCGNAVKTPLLLRHLGAEAVYVPIDICRTQLEQSALRIAALHPEIDMVAMCADYMQLQALPARIKKYLRRVIFFPGSTIGNYTPEEAQHLLRHAAKLAGPGGGMLVGVDCKKDPAILNSAYNDAAQLTRAFNLNLLTRMKNELGAQVQPDSFTHYAFYNPTLGRVEMHLISQRKQVICIAGEFFPIDAGESIHTENSYKYRPDEFQQLARNAGWQPEAYWTDADNWFSVHYLSLK
ncbi:MAG: L-histidine N(alpha)-methyltransferase [Pseudomonadota bacterium]